MAAGERSPLIDSNVFHGSDAGHADLLPPNVFPASQSGTTSGRSQPIGRKISSSSGVSKKMSLGPSSHGQASDGSYSNPEQSKYTSGTQEEPNDEFAGLSASGDLPSSTSCRVCGSMIDIGNKREQHVVKCDYCNEATPIREAPPGQKYIRCPCNCLLICKSRAQKISCPRPACRRVIVLFTPSSQTQQLYPSEVSPVPGMCRVTCGHCEETFLFNSLTNQLARCPHCEKKSSVGRDFARARGLIFLILTLMSLGIAIVVTIVTNPQVRDGQKGWIALYSFFYVLAIYFILRSLYFLSMKTSEIQNTNP
ncbi:Type 1 phosphatidylinositol 4,5-bisphosphate 4-phosphatase [Fragariocoptes setiger]|uniref:Phosphatidylinositol-4,5-bisphosphate 4-phosphatase n=1 Tax=Fragariocoptes setiger TaxID=1670756 RepID=A0ABQ7S7C8_9ACAR|nr:Type 1 phosphatidylinositol 4,5-bisphosphate 4-phosphatase [Fragariocoptes setiger]